MADDVRPRAGDEQEVSSSGLLLSVDPLQGTQGYKLSGDDSDTSDVLGGDDSGADASDSGGDADGSDSTDSDSTDDSESDADGTDISDADGTDTGLDADGMD